MKKRPGRLGSVAVALSLLIFPSLLISASSPPPMTDASWQRSEFGRGSFGTITIPPATLNGPCEYHPTLLGAGAYVRVFWKPPATYPNLTDAVIDVHLITAGSTVTTLQGYPGTANTTGSSAGYTTDIPATLLGGILGFNTQFQVDIYISAAGWKSTPVSVRANAGLVAGIGGSCTNL
ncbi:hypothetical protein StoSoilA2_04920 [Arthrobacter sp. StoSoilA2]|uniref:hypothetical protein n=1 Tax=Arthrobacter sp. StoSoilA2 TaxID=2830990 RepID=UPI001CC35D29|nr:hypothetical protein [Arthrobacter sp. StoSoilA2]BCW34436.1 hypothetical protein StoSoilA2_04920 [Arthrobacter sp. StoSoilA2]